MLFFALTVEEEYHIISLNEHTIVGVKHGKGCRVDMRCKE